MVKSYMIICAKHSAHPALQQVHEVHILLHFTDEKKESQEVN